jgi:DNA-binding NarL/FixJ family response regulator
VSLLRKLRIIVADDNALFLQNLVLLLAAEFDVVATAPDGEAALDLVRRFRPDAVVVDLHLPMLNGIEIANALTKHRPGPPVVICSVENDPEIAEAARKAGALALVSKARLERDLALAVKSAVEGERFVSPAD